MCHEAIFGRDQCKVKWDCLRIINVDIENKYICQVRME